MNTRVEHLLRVACVVPALVVFAPATSPLSGADIAAAPWSEFRGPNGSGVATGCRPPVELDVDRAAWTSPVPPGRSSPVLRGELLVLTAAEGKTLLTLGFDRSSGKRIWSRKAPEAPLEKVHRASSPAASTPCIDDEHVYAYFGSWGLLAYDHAGREVWKRRVPTPKSLYGMSTSPIVHAGLVILVVDNDADMPDSRLSQSRILALDRATGKTAWETHRPLHRSGWSTPTIWSHDAGVELVVLGNGWLRGYDVATGVERWSVSGFSRETVARPIVASGVLLASASMLGGVADDQPDPAPFWKAVLRFDANGDGKIVRAEMTEHFTFPFRPDLPVEHPGFGLPLPRDPARRSKRLDGMFRGIDKNGDGFWTEEEFLARVSFNRGKPNLLAVRPGGEGDVTESHVAWSLHRNIPEVPSPVFHDGHVFLLRDGGVLAAAEAKTGKILRRGRIGAGGHYAASPVIAGEHLYAVSEEGVVSVVRVNETLDVVHREELGSRVSATPAIDRETIYIRTTTELIAFR